MGKQITSLQNPEVKRVVRLRDRRERNKKKEFLIEGYREIQRVLLSDVPIDVLMVCPELFLGSNEKCLIEQAIEQEADVHFTSKRVFEKMSYRDRPDGLIAIAPQVERSLQELQLLSKNAEPFYLVAEAIEKPGNLGTILRSCDAVDVDGVIVCDRCTDIYNPNVVRASTGTLFTRPVIEAESSETFLWLKDRGVKVVAATPDAEVEFTKADLTGPIAVAVGTEQLGLSEIWMKAADLCIKIPMLGEADSLNVATATTLLLYGNFTAEEFTKRDKGYRFSPIK